MVTYVNDLRLSELATGEGSGTWGTTTNTNLELIGEALGYGTEQSFSSDADATTTIGDGVSDPARAMYFKVTSAGSLTATRTLTIAPNTVSRVMFIENATTGSQSIAISQGSGASVTILTGKTAVVYLDGAGATAAVVDAMSGVDPGVTDTLTEVLVAGNTSGGTNIELSTTDKVQFRDADIYLNSSVDGQLDIVADTEIQIAATTVDLNGDLDVSGTALVTGVLTTTAATVFNGGFASNADSTLGTDKKVQFRDSAIYINSSADGQLDLVADTEIQIAATTIDVNGTLAFDSLKGTGATTVTNILDEDNMGSDSATAIATQQSIKAYVDSQVGSFDTLAEVLAQGNTTGGTDLAVSTGDDITFADSSKATFGAGSDATIFSDGTSGYMRGFALQNKLGDKDVLVFVDGGATSIYYNNSAKLATTATGIDVTGTANATHMQVSNGGKYIFGGEDTRITGETDGSGKIQLFTGGTEKVILDGSNVGIGTSSPKGKINSDVGNTTTVGAFSSSGLNITSTSGATNNIYQIGFGYASGATNAPASIYALTTSNAGFNNNAICFATRGVTTDTAPTERMRVGSNGAVVISHADTASEGLRVIQTTAARTSGGALGLFYDDQGGTTQPTLMAIQNGTGDILQLFDGGAQVVTVKDGGNLLVGTTTTPSLAGLAVGSTAAGKNISVFSSANGTNGLIGIYQSNGTQEGQLYAGTGDVNLFGTSVVKVVASSGGVQLTSGATSWTSISDERAKDIIEPISNAVQKVSNLRSVIGKYKTDSEGTRRSFLIAQDVQAVFPEAVDTTDEDNLGVRYTETIPLLVAAMKEQQATIEALTARITALES
jgi:hypothetical protein